MLIHNFCGVYFTVVEFEEKVPSDADLKKLKAVINEAMGYPSGRGLNFALFHQGDIVDELNDEQNKQLKIKDLFEAEEGNPSIYVFDCYTKNAGIPSWLKRKKKIDFRNATPYRLKVEVAHKIRDFDKEKDK